MQQAGEIAARPRHAGDEACADRIVDVDEHDRDRAGFPLQCGRDLSGMREDYVGPQGD